MSRYIAICGIGLVQEDILANLVECIATRCGLTSRIFTSLATPKYAYNDTRCQYDSKLILKYLIQQCPHDAIRFVGVTPVDLYVPILKFVFGLAQIEGRCAVISTHRLCPRFYDQPSNPDLLLARIDKTVVHELGHTFGITHCRDRRCVMFSSTRIEDTDYKQPDFCPTCLELFKWHLEKVLQ